MKNLTPTQEKIYHALMKLDRELGTPWATIDLIAVLDYDIGLAEVKNAIKQYEDLKQEG